MTASITPTPVPWPRSWVRSGRWLGRLLRIWASPNRRFLTTPPGHFYSPLPDSAELERDAPRLYEDPGDHPPGLDLNTEHQLAFVRSTQSLAANAGFSDRPVPEERYYSHNVYFPPADAIPLSVMLRAHRPARVVEVGSGFSSACMLDTCDRVGLGTRFTFIDPYPDRLRSLLRPADESRVRVVPTRVQDVPPDVFDELHDGDFLFIDSSHVSKAGSDVNHLLFRVLPRLRPGVFVHIHDIFWPFEYPAGWYADGRAWNELYLVRAFLTGSRAFVVQLFGSYLEARHREHLAAHWPAALRRSDENPHVGAASLWVRKTA